MRYLMLFTLLSVISLTSFAQNDLEQMPFAYVYQNAETHQLNMTLMDARTGEVILTYDDDSYCLVGFARDRRFFIYSQNPETNYIVNTASFAAAELLPEGQLINFATSADGNLLALHYGNYGENYISLYETRTKRLIFSTQYFYTTFPVTMFFEGTDLLYAFPVSGTNIITFHRQSSYHDELRTFTLDAEVTNVSISPNGNFLIVVENGSINAINMKDNSHFSIGQTDYIRYLRWVPNQDTTLVYLVLDDSGNTRIVEYDLYTQDNTVINTSRLSYLLPNTNYIFYSISDENNNYRYQMLNLATNEETELDFGFHDRWEWLSPSQFVFADVSSSQNNNRDMFFYDINTGEKRQLTNTPEVDERFDCAAG